MKTINHFFVSLFSRELEFRQRKIEREREADRGEEQYVRERLGGGGGGRIERGTEEEIENAGGGGGGAEGRCGERKEDVLG